MSGEIEPLNGPDQLIAGAKGLTTCAPDGCVTLRDVSSSDSSLPPLSVPTLLKRAAEKNAAGVAMAVKREGKWLEWNYKQYHQDSRTIAKAFIKLGLERFYSVGILGFNAPEWFIAQMGAIMAGGFSSGIYTTNSPEACKYIALNCRAQIMVVEDEKQLDKILQIQPDLPDLKVIVQYLGSPKKEGVLSWEDLLQIGAGEPDDQLEERLKRIAINQCCALIYTSGTTGPPKGVMMSHDNLTWTARVADAFNKVDKDDVFLSYLPLSHSAAQMLDVWMPMAGASAVYFADRNAMKGTLAQTMKEARPTIFFGVPRVYEKIQEKMVQIGKSGSGFRKAVAGWAKKTGLQHNLKALEAQGVDAAAEANVANALAHNSSVNSGYSYPIAKKLVFSKVRANLGLDRCRIAGAGAAPMTLNILEYFLSLDIPLVECYGMSETSGPHCGNRTGQHRLGTVGTTLPGCSTRIHEPDPDGNGEILMRGRHITMGYLYAEEQTKEAINQEGWLHSGDIGQILPDGYVQITGRIKELIITAGGENVPPVLIEDLIKKEVSGISNVMLVGDRRKFLSCLVTLKVDIDQDTLEPRSELSRPCLDWCKEIGSKARTVEEAVADKSVLAAIQLGLDRANAHATSNAQKVQKFALLSTDFSVPGGELGPTLKLKRHYVLKKYVTQINNFYNV